MNRQFLNQFEDILQPLGDKSAQFFLAASLYHAQKVSFKRAAELANLSFDEFNSRLKEHFSIGYILHDEVILKDLKNISSLLKKK